MSSGCANTAVKIVSDYRTKHSQLWLEGQDYDNIDKIRQTPYKTTFDKIFDNTTINEKEYDESMRELYE